MIVGNTLREYFDALERMKKGCPERVPKGTKINNDSVSVEAGRTKGSIKKSRERFTDLIQAIDNAVGEKLKPQDVQRRRAEKFKAEAQRYRALWEEALVRELSLLNELLETRKALAQATGAKVVLIKRTKTGGRRHES